MKHNVATVKEHIFRTWNLFGFYLHSVWQLHYDLRKLKFSRAWYTLHIRHKSAKFNQLKFILGFFFSLVSFRLGMFHDMSPEAQSCPDGQKLMAQTRINGAGSFQWSQCSKSSYENFIKWVCLSFSLIFGLSSNMQVMQNLLSQNMSKSFRRNGYRWPLFSTRFVSTSSH